MKRLNIITLGVKDLQAAKQFYCELFDWEPEHADENIVFFNMGGWRLALFNWERLAEDAKLEPNSSGFRGVTLAHNVIQKAEVQPLLNRAVELGGRLLKPAQDVFWGGHSGYFADLDGHSWEVAFNPFTKTLEDGTLDIPKI